MLAEQKIASMVECKDFRKGIIQLEWENKMRRMQIEDLSSRARDIQILQLTEEQQDVSVIRILQDPLHCQGPKHPSIGLTNNIDTK